MLVRTLNITRHQKSFILNAVLAGMGLLTQGQGEANIL
jgi:hypothetical protein